MNQAVQLLPQDPPTLTLTVTQRKRFLKPCLFCRLEDFDGEEVDEEALIEQRRQQRMAIVQVGTHC